MTLEHVALWTTDLERSRSFYTTYFGGKANDLYHNPSRQFTSYFLRFTGGARLELMHLPTLVAADATKNEIRVGYAHLAFSTGSPAAVDLLTERLRTDGYTVLGEPRTTGDGYYESIVADPDGNVVEITA